MGLIVAAEGGQGRQATVFMVLALTQGDQEPGQPQPEGETLGLRIQDLAAQHREAVLQIAARG
jgi:hypothetical protein